MSWIAPAFPGGNRLFAKSWALAGYSSMQAAFTTGSDSTALGTNNIKNHSLQSEKLWNTADFIGGISTSSPVDISGTYKDLTLAEL